MRHHKYNPDYNFIKSPIEFNKYTERSILQYCLGATMYMPGTRDFASEIITNKYPGLTSFVLCFEMHGLKMCQLLKKNLFDYCASR